MPASLNPKLEKVALDACFAREPVSKRTYTCLRLKTRSGGAGYGECSRIARWSAPIEADFTGWLRENIDKLPVARERVEEILKQRQK